MIPWLDPRQLWFPDPRLALADPPGLLAAGGDLTPERLIKAYSMGIFPWFEHGQPILWWSPDPRAVMHPQDLKLRRSLPKILRNKDFTVSFDLEFARVQRLICRVDFGADPDRELNQLKRRDVNIAMRGRDIHWE